MSDAGSVVPREAEPQLRHFTSLLEHWSRRVNLFARGDINDLWQRHVVDSAQLVALAQPHARTWLDLGSGAGFPGLVCAAICQAQGRSTSFTLIEADGRKVAFLREAARALDLDVAILNERIERVSLPAQDVISARALASLDALLDYAWPFCHSGTRLLCPKGSQADSELTLARRRWHIRAIRVPSRSDPTATILQISEVRRRR